MAIDNVLKHGVNNFFILVDVLLSRQPFVSYHYQVGRLGNCVRQGSLLLTWHSSQAAVKSLDLHACEQPACMHACFEVSGGKVGPLLSVCSRHRLYLLEMVQAGTHSAHSWSASPFQPARWTSRLHPQRPLVTPVVCAAQAVLVYGTVYLVFMFIYHGASSEWVYYVLDWDKPSALALYVTLPLALFVVFVVWCAPPGLPPLPSVPCLSFI